MLKFTIHTDKTTLPKTKRIVYAGCRETAPQPGDRFSLTTKDSFAKNIKDVGILPMLILWENTKNEPRYTLVQNDESAS